MKSTSLKRIETGYKQGLFSVRLYNISKSIGIKTVGKLKKYCLENERVSSGRFGGRSTWRILEEIEDYERTV